MERFEGRVADIDWTETKYGGINGVNDTVRDIAAY